MSRVRRRVGGSALRRRSWSVWRWAFLTENGTLAKTSLKPRDVEKLAALLGVTLAVYPPPVFLRFCSTTPTGPICVK